MFCIFVFAIDLYEFIYIYIYIYIYTYYFNHLMQRIDSMEKTLMLGKIEGRTKRGWQRMMVGWHHRLDAHESEQALGFGHGQGSLVCCRA